jgi:hypothetical protein
VNELSREVSALDESIQEPLHKRVTRQPETTVDNSSIFDMFDE